VSGTLHLAVSEDGGVPRPAPLGALALTPEERAELVQRVYGRTTTKRQRKRALVILLAADGMSNRAIAERVGFHQGYVGLWRKRFLASRLNGLEDLPRPGRPRVRGDAAREAIEWLIAQEGGPRSDKPWTIRRITEVLRQQFDLTISVSQVRRILIDLGIPYGQA
jgi:transposase